LTTRETRLLVSVRSADEALAAVSGGASVIDVKEPDAGPLGRAPASIWRDVRRAVPPRVPVSVALGELSEWRTGPTLLPGVFNGLSFCKLGLAHAGPGWRDEWRALRERLSTGDCRWIAVVYADWRTAGAPEPDDILAEAITEPAVAGVLVDTFDKSRPARYDARWLARAWRVKDAGRMLAMAGGLTHAMIRELAALEPDLIAVRGAACAGGDRRGTVDERRVADLAEMVRALSARL
jgi:uncharacterized protein (UPF0264 family)